MVDFTLRPMEATDGPAIGALMRDEAQTTTVSLTTHYRYDVHDALLAQHPSLFGVVAVRAGDPAIVGVATAFLDEVMIGGDAHPVAYLENLKVRGDVRRQGLGARLAAWRIDEARRRFGGEGVIMAGIEASNAASLATANRWATQVLGPVRIVIANTTARARASRGIEIRPLVDGDVTPVIDALETFYGGYDLVPRMTATKLAAGLAPTAIGEAIRQYRVAVATDGTLLAGAGITERFKLMADHIDAIPLPIAVLGRLTGMIPGDRIIRSIELHLAWHAPGRVDALRVLWDAIRVEWHDRATNVVALADPRGSSIEAFHVGRTLAPKLRLMVPVMTQSPVDPARPLYLWR